jgi:hypothetical protein
VPIGVDVDGFHRWLWWRADARHTLRVVQTQLAETWKVTPYTMNRLLARLVKERRLVPLEGRAGSASATYEVVDPDQSPSSSS